MAETLTPREKYQRDLELTAIYQDPVQEQAVSHTQRLYEQLLAGEKAAPSGWWQRFFPSPKVQPKGLYFWGGVGRGKTYVVDSFFECLPMEKKQRRHFHVFVRTVHEQLKYLPKTPDPLQIIAEELAQRVSLLVLDEFHVYDVADAMLLVGLLPALHARGICLVLTSNVNVDQLYLNGLQRERFEQVITFLQQHSEVFEFSGAVDYRAKLLASEGICHVGVDQDCKLTLEAEFKKLVGGAFSQDHLLISGRNIEVYGLSTDVVWIDFQQLCMSARSTIDYIELARRFPIVVSGHIPVMNQYQDDIARRFIHLIDVLYDHNVKFIFSADDMPENLYGGDRLADSFKRTVSRLREMCSEAYLKQPHRIG